MRQLSSMVFLAVVAVLLAAVVPLHADSAEADAPAFAPSTGAVTAAVTRTADAAASVAAAVSKHSVSLRARAVAAVPEPYKGLAGDLLSGAISVVTAGRTATPAAAGFGAEGELPQATPEGQMTAVHTHTTSKFAYALGASAMELLLVRLLYREPQGNRRHNHRVLAFFSSPFVFPVVAALLAVPNGVAPVGVLVVLLFRLCDSVYVPLLISANYLRPYLAAALATCPRIAAAKAAVNAYVESYVGAASSSGAPRGEQQVCCGKAAETLLWFCVVGAVFFLVVANRMDGDAEDDDDELPSSHGSEASDSEAEEEEAPARKSGGGAKKKAPTPKKGKKTQKK